MRNDLNERDAREEPSMKSVHVERLKAAASLDRRDLVPQALDQHRVTTLVAQRPPQGILVLDDTGAAQTRPPPGRGGLPVLGHPGQGSYTQS